MNELGWFYADQGQQVGPVSRLELVELIRSGRVGAASQVWHETMTNWAPVRDTELAGVLPGGGPPPMPGVGGVQPAFAGASLPGASLPGTSFPGAPSPGTSLPGASLGEAFSRFWRQYVVFSGRASRSEYWFAVLGLFLLGLGTLAADFILLNSGDSGMTPLTTILNLAALLPTLALGARRLHDIDRSAWWMLIGFVPLVGGIVLLVFACTRGTAGPNRYGS